MSADDFCQQEVHCPGCAAGDGYLHQGDVRVQIRDHEDSHGTRVEVASDGAVTVSRIEDGFVGRRDDLRIRFYCESCAHEYYLVIWQHKGRTYMCWERIWEGGCPSSYK